MMEQELKIYATEPSLPKAHVVRSDKLREEIARRRMLERVLILISLLRWLGTTIPIICVASSQGLCTFRVRSQWLIGEW